MWTGYIEVGVRPSHPGNSTYVLKQRSREAVEHAVREIEQDVSGRPGVQVLSVETVPDQPAARL